MGACILGEIFLVEGMSKFLASGGGLPFDSIYNNDKENQVVWHLFHLFIFLIDFMMSSHDHYTRSSKKCH